MRYNSPIDARHEGSEPGLRKGRCVWCADYVAYCCAGAGVEDEAGAGDESDVGGVPEVGTDG